MRSLVLLALLGSCRSPGERASEPVRVAAASDLTGAFEELAQRYEHESGKKVELTFGASGQLSRQLAAGAPFDAFAAADVGFAAAAAKSGRCDIGTLERYARGRLVVFARQGPVTLEQLGGERLRRIALANPETAPYGRAAREALTAAGLYDRVKDRLVFAETVRQALQLAETGNVDAALVADALVLGRPEATPVDPQLYAPLVQAVVLCNGRRANGFVTLLRSEEGVALMKRFGFEPP